MTTILRYELWDLDSANRAATVASLAEALAIVREIQECSGREAVRDFGVGAIQQDEAGHAELVPILDGDQLLAHITQERATPA